MKKNRPTVGEDSHGKKVRGPNWLLRFNFKKEDSPWRPKKYGKKVEWGYVTSLREIVPVQLP